jgi:hypothetical protein
VVTAVPVPRTASVQGEVQADVIPVGRPRRRHEQLEDDLGLAERPGVTGLDHLNDRQLLDPHVVSGADGTGLEVTHAVVPDLLRADRSSRDTGHDEDSRESESQQSVFRRA